MPRGSGPTNRHVVNHGVNGKGDVSRVTDVSAYRENFESIDWSSKKKPFLNLQELHDEWEKNT